MTSGYRIDVEHELVVIWVEGPFRAEDVMEGRKRLTEDPDFDPSFDQLVDLSRAQVSVLTPDRLRQLARSTAFDDGARRALVAPSDLTFGMSRMYQALSEASLRQETRVFRDMDRALEWLEVPSQVVERGGRSDAGPAGG